MSHTGAVINAGFYNLVQKTKDVDNNQIKCSNSSSDNNNIFQRIMPIIPKVNDYIENALFLSHFTFFVELFVSYRRHVSQRSQRNQSARI